MSKAVETAENICEINIFAGHILQIFFVTKNAVNMAKIILSEIDFVVKRRK